jgi:Zn-dependent peptidase ImmA (M78 family)
MAQAILHRHGLDSRPIFIERIVEAEGIRLIRTTFEDKLAGVSGALYIDQQGPVIICNSEHHPHRQRFTIAHELGHFFLNGKSRNAVFVDKQPMVRLRNDRSEAGVDPEEIDANAFAAALLMPKQLVLADVTQYMEQNLSSSGEIAESLAAEYKVSAQAMALRLHALGVI